MKVYGIITALLVSILSMHTVRGVERSRDAERGWTFYQSAAETAPVISRVEIDVPESCSGVLALNSCGQTIELKIKRTGRSNVDCHRYAIAVTQDRLDAGMALVQTFKDGQPLDEACRCRIPSSDWVISLRGQLDGKVEVFIPDPLHSITVSALDHSPEADRFISGLLSQMTLDEKIGQLSQYVCGTLMTGPDAQQLTDSLLSRGMIGSVLNASGSDALRMIQEKNMAESRLKIPVLFGMDVIHGYRTLFPVPLAEACSWDTETAFEAARIAAMEASAAGVHWTFAPMVDIARDARWGRIVEGAGEDTFLGCKMAEARVKGFQWNLWGRNSVLACAKHWIAYGLPQAGRDYAPVDMSERTLYDVYLPPFKASLDAGALTFMSAFNDLNGIPASGDHKMLRSFMQKNWAFDGFVVSDWQSVEQLVTQGVAEDRKDAARIAFNAGVDMDMTDGIYNENLHQLVNEGLVSEKAVDEAVTRILRVKYSLGLFEDPFKFFDKEYESATLHKSEFVEAARKAACKSMVLLRNEGNLLPLSKEIGSIALVGPLADDRHEINGSWRCRALDSDAVTVREGLERKLGGRTEIRYVQGCGFNDSDTSKFEEAVKAASGCDVIIAVVGEKALFSGESRSRAILGLPGVQQQFVERLSALGKPLVVVLMNGRPLCIDWIAENVPAVLEAWFPGTTAGDAVADVLFGDYNPSGRLAVSFPKVEGQIPCYYNYKRSGRPGDMQFSSTVRHIDVPNAPLYPFGYGLSYTTFTYGNLKTGKENYSRRETIEVTVDVTNTGNVPGEETVQVYVSDRNASVVRPVRELKGFSKVFLQPGQTKTVAIRLDPISFGFHDADMKYVVEDGIFDIFAGHDSTASDCVTIKLED